MHIIGGKLKNHTIIAPTGLATRPTSSRLRETLFNICQGYIEGANFLDLFAGSGAMGLEALSRGASYCTFIDSDRNSFKAIQSNLEAMGQSQNGKVIMGNVFAWLERLSRENRRFDIIYADPPYDAQMKGPETPIAFSQRLIEIIDTLPLLRDEGVLFIEDSAKFKPSPQKLSTLEFVNQRQAGRSSLLQFRRLTN